MVKLNYFVVSLLLLYQPFNVNSLQTITVVVSKPEPFVISKYGKQTLDGLDVKIIENFGQKFNFKIDYIMANESLNAVLSSEYRIRNFLKSIEKK